MQRQNYTTEPIPQNLPPTTFYNMPIHRKDLKFLDLKGFTYKVTERPCFLKDVVLIDIEVKGSEDLSNLIHVGKLIATDSWNQSINAYKMRAAV